MDYCHPCRRHLNGALACAGCGTPADALVPYAVAYGPGRAAEPADETPVASGPAGHRRRARAAARRPGRRTHRRRGRALLLTAAGLVLALGALSLAELAMEPGGDSGASEYVSEATSSPTEPLPSASSSAEPDDPGPVGAPTVVPVTDSHSATATVAPSRTAEPAASPPASAPEVPSPSAPAPADPDPDPDPTDTPAEPPGTGEPTTAPTSPEPSDEPAPTPSPTETCIWWIFCP
ncbi:SCO2400 family protein [Streptomyces atroolivaceus]|uniref:SCO2400 family protein n=1 Tax=Streptomyces atroolivaceus TaxID=66869 RepID=UPI00362B00BA